MTPCVVCLSGRIGSGKTSVSSAFASAHHSAVTGFGAFVRAEAGARGLDSTRREVLQDLGEELISMRGNDWLCRQVIATANWKRDRDLVIDGVRHVSVFEAIKLIVAPTTALLVHLQLDFRGELDSRGERRGIAPLSRPELEAHSTERDVIAALPAVADLVVIAEWPVEQIVAAIYAFLNERRAKG